MPNFTYKALDGNKLIVSGMLAGKTREEIAQVLAKRGLAPLTVRDIPEKSTIRGTIPPIEKIVFCRYLSTMLSSGLSLSEGIDVLREESKHPLMRRILGDMSYSLEQGQQLSTVFERYPNVFESYFLTLTRAGEISGTLSEVFRYLEAELRAEYNLSSKVKGALMYPSIVFTAMIGIGVLMFFFVLPQIGKVFLNLKLPLPQITRFLFQFSIVLSQQMIPLVISGILVLVGGFLLLKKRAVRDLLFHLLILVPMVKNMIKKIDMARFTRIFSTLLKSAVPITEALEISLSSLTWYEYRDLAIIFPEEIRKGKSLSSVVKSSHKFPTLIIQMIATGERAGNLDTTLAELASFYEQEVEEELKNLTQILEPVLMLLVGISVGAMILSIIAPIYSVVGSFQSAAGGSASPPVR